jgi:hypothetical protein
MIEIKLRDHDGFAYALTLLNAAWQGHALGLRRIPGWIPLSLIPFTNPR